MSEKRKILFVINTMGRGGAEMALIELLKRLDPARYDVSLYVMLGQGELIDRVPEYVRLLNQDYDRSDVLSAEGKRIMRRRLLRRLLHRGALLKNLPYFVRNYAAMRRARRVQIPKLLWRPIADGTEPPKEEFDLAVAYLEGAATYYVSEKVHAEKKAAFFHVDYQQAGYTRGLDLDDYQSFDRVFCVSESVRQSFIQVYPEYAQKADVFHNLLNRQRIISMAEEPGGFQDGFDGFRIVTLGRLVKQKALEFSIDALALLKKQGVHARWYVFGEGEERYFLEKRIDALGLREDFLLPGVVDNPYPYLRQADIYAHCSAFEGRSVAVQEALILRRPVVATNCPGTMEQITDGVNGLLTELKPEAIAERIKRLIQSPALREQITNVKIESSNQEDTYKLLDLLTKGEKE